MEPWERCFKQPIPHLKISKTTKVATKFSISPGRTWSVLFMMHTSQSAWMRLRQIHLAPTGPTWLNMELKIVFTNWLLQAERLLEKPLMLSVRQRNPASFLDRWGPVQNFPALVTQLIRFSKMLTTPHQRGSLILVAMLS